MPKVKRSKVTVSAPTRGVPIPDGRGSATGPRTRDKYGFSTLKVGEMVKICGANIVNIRCMAAHRKSRGEGTFAVRQLPAGVIGVWRTA